MGLIIIQVGDDWYWQQYIVYRLSDKDENYIFNTGVLNIV